MTVTQYSAHLLLLLLIALATITLGTQPERGDASEGESTSTGGCISDWREMKKAYLERQSSADVDQRKLQLVTITTCASGMFAPVERRETPQAQGPKM